jgi:nitrite reductase/ring-hydroxylating ferredoxin subunit
LEKETHMTDLERPYTRLARTEEVRAAGCLTVQASGHTLALWAYGERIYAVDNRCPHMGFPLSQGSLHDGLLICHWHHARFDLASGGTFDQFADDVRTFPVRLQDGEVWADLGPQPAPQQRQHQRERLRDGLERDIPLVLAKSILSTMDGSPEQAVEPFRIGLDFGTHYREAGWGQGLTILTCMLNLLPYAAAEDRPRALYQGLSAVARESAGMAPRFQVRALPGTAVDMPTLKRWFRQFVEVRDAEGAERALVSAVRACTEGETELVPAPARAQIADMLFSAATDHRYIQIGHVLDFTNKALEALDQAGWQAGRAERVLSSLATAYANATRMEEANAWRSPLDLIALLEQTFEALPAALDAGRHGAWTPPPQCSARERLTPVLLGEDPAATTAALVTVLREGCPADEAAEAVAYAAALRIAQFHTSNEFTDWDTALHTFTFSNAVHQGLRRCHSEALVRGLFDAAMSLYLDRFLNVPAQALPGPDAAGAAPPALAELSSLLDRQQQVEPAAEVVAEYLYAGGDPAALQAQLVKLLLREDRDFHTIQTVEAALRQYALLRGSDAGAPAPAEAVNVLVAATRYLAAHAPTMRAQGQTYQIAQRLARGERLFEG